MSLSRSFLFGVCCRLFHWLTVHQYFFLALFAMDIMVNYYVQGVAPKKTKVYVSEVAYGVLSQAEVQEAVEKEFVTLQDRVMEETKDRTIAMKAYVNNLRPRESYQCTLFSFSDLEKATNYFDPSLKIGEGGYGSIYRGILYHTEVAIKILHPDSMQGPREFQQEVIMFEVCIDILLCVLLGYTLILIHVKDIEF